MPKTSSIPVLQSEQNVFGKTTNEHNVFGYNDTAALFAFLLEQDQELTPKSSQSFQHFELSFSFE